MNVNVPQSLPTDTPRPAVFFDRDGVLNIDNGFAHHPDQIEWVPGAFEAVKNLNELGYLVFVVTNQSGIARGLYTEEHVKKLHAWMTATFQTHAARIDAFAYCPHHPDGNVAAYKTTCTCRKPAPGMLSQLMNQWPVWREKSFMIGDRETDLAAAEAAGVKGHLFSGGRLDSFVARITAL